MGAYDPTANSFAAESKYWLHRSEERRCLPHRSANAPVTLWPGAAEHINEIGNQSKPQIPGQRDVTEPTVLERRAFVEEAEGDWLPRAKPSSCPPWGCLAFVIKMEHSTVRRGGHDPLAEQKVYRRHGTGKSYTASRWRS